MRERLSEALNNAIKAQDKRCSCTLRLINAAIKDRDISARGSGKEKVSDDEVLAIMAKMIKQREESSKMYDGAGRPELAAQEREEIDIIRAFLPAQLPEEEVRQVVRDVVEDLGANSLRDMGKCINTLKKRYPGKMDFSKASGVVKEYLMAQ